MNPKVIYFDLGDTLVYFRSSNYWIAALWAAYYIWRSKGKLLMPWVLRRALEDAFRAELLERNGNGLSQVKDELSELRYWEDFFKQVLARIGLSENHSILIAWLARRYMDPRSYACFPEVRYVLKQLRDQGILLGVLSNAFPSADGIMRHLNLMQYFKIIIFSYEIPHIPPKPQPEIYRYALSFKEVQEAIQSREQVWFVDDRSKFVDGASEVGLHALQIDRENVLQPDQAGCIANLKYLLFRSKPGTQKTAYLMPNYCPLSYFESIG